MSHPCRDRAAARESSHRPANKCCAPGAARGTSSCRWCHLARQRNDSGRAFHPARRAPRAASAGPPACPRRRSSMRHRSSSVVRAAAAIALALAAAACTDRLTTPAVDGRTAEGTTAAGSLSGGPQLISNHVRYRDQGFAPAIGRSGNAGLTVQALLGGDGRTEVEVSAYGVAPGTGTASLTHLQTR